MTTERLPDLHIKVLARFERCSMVTKMVHAGAPESHGRWRPYSFDSGTDPIAWTPLPAVNDPRWRPYKHDTEWNVDVLCLGKFTDSPEVNIHVGSMHSDPFPGFMGKMPPMWGVTHWMTLAEAFRVEEFTIPKSFLDLPTYHAVKAKEDKLLENQLVNDVYLAITNDGEMYRRHFSDAGDGKLVSLGRAKRSIIGWRKHDEELKRGFRHWMMGIVNKYNLENLNNGYLDTGVCSRIAIDLLDHYERIAIETTTATA